MIECGFGVQIPLHIHAPVHSESHFQGSVPDSGVDSGSDQALLNMKHALSCLACLACCIYIYIYIYICVCVYGSLFKYRQYKIVFKCI